MMTGLFVSGIARQMAEASRAETAGAQAARIASDVRTQNVAMQRDIEKLFMITEALWTLLKKHHDYTDEQLGELIEDIDLRDGKLDGKVAREPNPACPTCRRVLLGKHPVCLYCGTAVARGVFER